ncbi:probable BTB/POZ domain-containing protein KCTD7 at N-terminal half [Coccomyxa sp. Obi]|nr:probable BTB/POZ domain-containing protein KCTD7 at N-terminal half [Coccomyxa sp. Obi]
MLFTTSLQTLKKDEDSILAGLFSGAGLANCAIDPDGRFFLDRDPKHFATILNYLRDGECDLPSDPRERRELAREAEHFEISGLEELLNTGHGLVTEAAVPAAGIPHASEAYNRIIEKARAEAGAGNIARAESALFALMYGPNLAQPASPFDQDTKPGRSPTPDARRASSEKGSAIVQLGRASISLRTHSSSSSSQDASPLDMAAEYGAHCSGAELAAFLKRYFSVIQFDFMRRGYVMHADRGAERLYLEIPIGAAAPAEASGAMFEGLVQSLAECCVAGEGRNDARGMSFRKVYKKH